MKPWSLIVLLFGIASIFCLNGCQQADTKADPAFQKIEATDADKPELDRSDRAPVAPAA
jgi:outer membrane lipoprotein-sorting protein